jgi:hypothetical protein
MKVEIKQLASKPDAQYPYNYRVAFYSDSRESERITNWILEQKLPGSIYATTNDCRVFYTTEKPAALCALRWSQ